MRGLVYATGLAERDPDLAPLIVPNPDIAQAPVERRAAQDALDHGRALDAVSGFTRAVLNDPTSADSYAGLGRTLLRARRVPEGAAALRSALERDPQLSQVREKLAVVEQGLGRHGAATDQWRELIAREPDFPDARARLAVLLYLPG